MSQYQLQKHGYCCCHFRKKNYNNRCDGKDACNLVTKLLISSAEDNKTTLVLYQAFAHKKLLSFS